MRVWLDGRIVPQAEATVSVFDRGFLFGDGVYEVVRFFAGVGTGLDLHVARLRESLRRARIEGIDAGILRVVCQSLLADLQLSDATVYLQVTRGAGAERTHIPAPNLRPTVFAYAVATAGIETLATPGVVRAVLVEDARWARCEIKTLSLQGNILHLLDAAAQDADEAILCRDKLVGEGTGSNVFAFVGGVLVTPPVASHPPILHGVMRSLVLECAARAGIPHAVRPLPVTELRGASEAFVTGSKRILGALSHLDGRAMSQPAPGPRTMALNAVLVQLIAAG
ncbi:MAG: D-amino acid aminotransferase [Phycisphaerales bacterium]|nr:D-amino acid aminotransferase [Phycisphaerales bacterium]